MTHREHVENGQRSEVRHLLCGGKYRLQDFCEIEALFQAALLQYIEKGKLMSSVGSSMSPILRVPPATDRNSVSDKE